MTDVNKIVGNMTQFNDAEIALLAAHANLEAVSRHDAVLEEVAQIMSDEDAANYDEFCERVSVWPELEADDGDDETTSSDD